MEREDVLRPVRAGVALLVMGIALALLALLMPTPDAAGQERGVVECDPRADCAEARPAPTPTVTPTATATPDFDGPPMSNCVVEVDHDSWVLFGNDLDVDVQVDCRCTYAPSATIPCSFVGYEIVVESQGVFADPGPLGPPAPSTFALTSQVSGISPVDLTLYGEVAYQTSNGSPAYVTRTLTTVFSVGVGLEGSGDVNCDGEVGGIDSIAMWFWILDRPVVDSPGCAAPNSFDFSVGDINGDLQVDIIDALIAGTFGVPLQF